MSEPDSRKTSLLILNTGDGKGKSSSAFGVLGRAWARGWTAGVVQFLKSPKWQTGEQKLADHLGIEWHTMGDGFTWESDDLGETRRRALGAWKQATAMISSGRYDLVVLDEVTYTITFGWLPVSDIVSVLENRPERTNVVITGRDAAPELIALADTVTEMRKIKHVFDTGVVAKKGLDY